MKALILAPMDASYSRVRDAVENSIRESNIEPITLDQLIPAGAAWANAVTDAIKGADLVVADVSRQNTHILYELGFAHALRKPTLLLLGTDATGGVPLDLAGYQMLTYDPSDLPQLQSQIRSFLHYQQSRRAS